MLWRDTESTCRRVRGLLVLMAALQGTSLPASAQVVWSDEVAAVVNRHVITRSEVLAEAALQQVRRRVSEERSPAFLRSVLQSLIDQRILIEEAERRGVERESHDRERLLAELQTHFSNRAQFEAFLHAHGLSEAEVAEALERQRLATKLEERRVLAVPPPDDETVRQYYEEHRREFGKAPLEAVAESIRYRLHLALQAEELGGWTEKLRARSDVKVLLDFSEGADGG